MVGDHFWQLFTVGTVLCIALLVASRWAADSLLNPLFIYAPYIGFGACYVAFTWIEFSALALVASLGLLMYLSGLLTSFRFFYRVAVRQASCICDASKQYQLVATIIAICLGVFFIAIIPIFLSKGYGLDEAGNLKYSWRESNKTVYLLYFGLKYFILFSLAVARSRRLLIFSGIVYILGLAPLILLGSKGPLLLLLFDGAFVYYLRGILVSINGGAFAMKQISRASISRLVQIGLFGICVVIASPLAIYFMGAAPDYSTAFQVIFTRLLLGFDAAVYSLSAGLSPGQAGMESFVWWFAPMLKAVGLYTSPFNGVNHYVMYYYLGAAVASGGGMFPNNFQVMEAVLIFPPVIALPLLGLSGFLYGGAIAWFCRRRLRSPIYCLWLILLINNPYTMLIDGQSFWGNCVVWIGASLLILIVNALVVKKRRASGQGKKRLPKGNENVSVV